MQDVSLRDISRVLWGPTFQLAGLRSGASALVLTMLGLFFGMIESAGQAVGFLLFWTVGSTIGGVANIYLMKAISFLASPFTGGILTTVCTLTSYFIALLLASGDPLLYALKQRFPDLVPAADFGPLNMRAVIFVLDDAGSSPDQLEESEQIEADPSAA